MGHGQQDMFIVKFFSGAMLETSQKLLTKGFHPAAISDSLLHFSAKAVEVLESMAIPVDLTDNSSLLKSANTALNSKVILSFCSEK